MRNLNTGDLFTVMKIIRKTDFKNKLRNLDLPKDEQGNLKVSDNDYFVILIMEVVEGIPDAKDDLLKLMADLAGVTKKEMEEDEFEILPKLIEHIKQQDKLTSFLQQAFKSA